MAVIKEVAKLAGVSVGTVSKYLNNPQNLKEETRVKVESAIAELQYRPSPLARSMRTGKTNTLAVITPDITNPFFAEVYNSIRKASVNRGYTPVLYTTEDDIDTLKNYLEDISLHQYDGIILCFVKEDEVIENYIETIQSQIPIIQFSWDINNTKFNCLCIDVMEGVYTSTRHLISIGHKNIAYVGGSKSNRISQEKYAGYAKAMRDAGLQTKTEYEHYGDFTLQTGYFAARNFLMLPNIPEAIVAENDFIAIGALKYLLQQGIKIPDEVAVVGFDNIKISSMYEPSLSTIALPIPRMGEEALKLLMAIPDNPNPKNKLVILRSELIVRNSTDRYAPIQLDI
jgi:Transcriptional regulators